MKNIYIFCLLVISQAPIYIVAQNKISLQCEDVLPCLQYCQIEKDSLYGSPQKVHILMLSTDTMDICEPELAYEQEELVRTSHFAKERHAKAAINGGFFDTRKGGAIHYLEDRGLPISSSGDLVSVRDPSNLINGAIILYDNGALEITDRMHDSLYIQSNAERSVLVTGPVLIRKGSAMVLPDVSFVTKRHPRTLLAKNDDHLFLVTVDGRNSQAAGMSLFELRDLALSLGASDAINLDGGGSTSMYLKRGLTGELINHPSDLGGERRVANAILVIERPKGQ